MGIPTVSLIAVGLSMDCFAVSISSGLIIKDLRLNHALLIAFFFGLFQAMMPILGWLGGKSLLGPLCIVDHWIGFGILTFIGAKMIYESFKLDADKGWLNPMNFSVLILLSVATSIDALAVGFSFGILCVEILVPVLIIGSVAFIFSFIGVYIGDKFGHFWEKKIEFAGGLILIAIGIKILIEHSDHLF
jgi:manganese efflux pump family protein